MTEATCKSCSRCGLVKDYSEFRKNARMRCGFGSWCKSCISHHRSSVRAKRVANPVVSFNDKHCFMCDSTKPAIAFSVERGNKDGLSSICKPCRSKKHYASYAKDPELWKAKANVANRKRANKPSFVVHKRVAARVREWLGTRRGGKRTFDILGYSLPDLKYHLERQFTNGMDWDAFKRGEIHIDHIVPLSSFTAASADDDQVRRAWSLSNLRPLWASDNMRKSDKRLFLL